MRDSAAMSAVLWRSQRPAPLALGILLAFCLVLLAAGVARATGEGIDQEQWKAILQHFKADIETSEAQIHEYKIKLTDTIVNNNASLAKLERRRGQIVIWFIGGAVPRDNRNALAGLRELLIEAEAILEPLSYAQSNILHLDSQLAHLITELNKQIEERGNKSYVSALQDLAQTTVALQTGVGNLRLLQNGSIDKIKDFIAKLNTTMEGLRAKQAPAWEKYYLKKEPGLYSSEAWGNSGVDINAFVELFMVFTAALKGEKAATWLLVVSKSLGLAAGLFVLGWFAGRRWLPRIAPPSSLPYAARTWILISTSVALNNMAQNSPFVLFATLNTLRDIFWTAGLVFFTRFLYSATSHGERVAAGEKSLIWPLWAFNCLAIVLDDPAAPYLVSAIPWIVALLVAGRRIWLSAPKVVDQLDRFLFRLSGIVFPCLAFMTLLGWLSLAFVCASLLFFLVLTCRYGPSIHRLLDRWRTGYAATTDTTMRVVYALLSSIGLPVVVVAVFCFNLYEVARQYGAADLLLELASHESTLGGMTLSFKRVAVIFIGFYALRSFFSLSEAFFHRLPKLRPDINPGVAESLAAVARCAWWGGYALVALWLLGFDFTSLAVVAGGLSVGIGFGLQHVVNNFMCGLILLFGRAIEPGDTILLQGAQALVRRVGLRNTTVTTFENITYIVPNSELVSHLLINFSHHDPKVRKTITVGVAYGTDTELARTLLLQAAREHPEVLPKPPARVLFFDFGGSALEFKFQFWIDDVKKDDVTMSALRFRINELFNAHGVEIAFPQQDVHLRSAEGLKDFMAPQGKRDLIPAPDRRERRRKSFAKVRSKALNPL